MVFIILCVVLLQENVNSVVTLNGVECLSVLVVEHSRGFNPWLGPEFTPFTSLVNILVNSNL